MHASLNFSPKDLPKLEKALAVFPSLGINTQYEVLRVKKGPDTVTVYSTGKLLIQGPRANESTHEILALLDLNEEVIFGLDETGRGESTGPFVITGVLGDSNKLRAVRDSKKTANVKVKKSIVDTNSLAVISISLNPRFIDSLRDKGKNLNQIESQVINSFSDLIQRLYPNAVVKVDGARLKDCKPEIQFIVKGDDLEPVISAASVIAKSQRDDSANKEKRKSWKTH